MEAARPQLHAPKHARYDAIHCALLTGLISNVGTKSDSYEYLGARGTRFSIFPGSALFSQKPKWLMAAELVETTKLYARVNAGIEPQWIERVAAHLVERTYSEPRYEAKTASVVATEKVTLYGLVLIAARQVHYGPINPRVARELFIHHALVLELLPTDAAFFRHNQALVREVELLEAKIRQRNLLADAVTRYTFYDARLPPTISNGADFESWRRAAERPHPQLLYMSKDDLLRADAPPITPEYYPDRVKAEGLNLPLMYRYEPGDITDGLTLTVPLAALTQLRAERYEWLVPGMLEEKIAALLRALPGAMRRNFVPVPDWSRAAAKALLELGAEVREEKSLRDALAGYLERLTGVNITAGDFAEAGLPDYLRMSFKVVDDTGKVLTTGRELPVLQRKLAQQAAGTFAQIYQREFHRDGIVAWDFGDLPGNLNVQRFGMTITAFPALVDQGEAGGGCGLRLFPSQKAADEAHRAGIRRLFRMEYRKEVKYIAVNLPRIEAMALHFHSLGKSEELKEQLLTLIVDRALFADSALMRTQAAYEGQKRIGAIRLLDVSDSVCELVAKILAEHHAIRLMLEDPPPPAAWHAATADVHDQMAYLLPAAPPGFLLRTAWEWLEHYPHFLAGIRVRLEKLRAASVGIVRRDAEYAGQIVPLWRQYLQRREEQARLGIDDPQLELYRWMIEEYRVSLFAQEIGTVFQISQRRLEKQWEKVRK